MTLPAFTSLIREFYPAGQSASLEVTLIMVYWLEGIEGKAMP